MSVLSELAFNDEFLCFKRGSRGEIYLPTERLQPSTCHKHINVEKMSDRIRGVGKATLVLPLQCVALDVIKAKDLFDTQIGKRKYPRPPMVGEHLHACCPTNLWAPALNIVVGYHRDPQTRKIDTSVPIFAVDVGPKGDGFKFVQEFYEAQAQARDNPAKKNNTVNEAAMGINQRADCQKMEMLSVSHGGSCSESKSGIVDELKSLMEMRQSGMLSEAEFAAAKAKLLSTSAPVIAEAVAVAAVPAPPMEIEAERL